MDDEQERLDQANRGELPWRTWGPYLSERAWGTVREDYSANGDAWSYLPFEQASSRAYRWSEDGLGGICDLDQQICLALALWNGKDPVVKERMYGLTSEQGNHGEDVKEYWWYLDATPTSSWLVWRYHYPQAVFPYAGLLQENAHRGRLDPEYELIDTGVFDGNRYWVVTATWAKGAPEDLLWRIQVRNMGPDDATIEVLPTIWFRNTWSWDTPDSSSAKSSSAKSSIDVGELGRPILTAEDDRTVTVTHPGLGRWRLTGAGEPELLFCDNDTNVAKLFGAPGPAYPKDGIAEHVISSAPSVNPHMSGTKAALRYRVTAAPGAEVELRLRFWKPGEGAKATPASAEGDLGLAYEKVMVDRKSEADRFYAQLVPKEATAEEALVLRQASAGMLWSKQYFHFNVKRWLDGDPAQPPPPPGRGLIRNGDWTHLDNRDVISMPDPWEYPWYASWDLAFHCVALAHLDVEFAKRQLILLGREWFMHPNGQLPAYEWNFSDVNPPVHAWAALRVWEIDWQARAGRGVDATPDFAFLERILHKLLLNFTWWVNRKDEAGNNIFEGGFLGLDNIGLFDRSRPLPVAGRLEQSDGTAWMAMYCLNLLEISLQLAVHDPVYEDVATKFFEHFTIIAHAMEWQGLWDDQDGFFYDLIVPASGQSIPVRARSLVGVVPLFAATVLDQELLDKLPAFSRRLDWFVSNKSQYAHHVSRSNTPGKSGRILLSVVGRDRLIRVLSRCLDPEELLSDHGLRSLSRYHLAHPFTLDLGGSTASVDYEPAESTTALFGGNSNWRGPVWFPLNYLLTEALDCYNDFFGEEFTVEHPTGSGANRTLNQVSDDLARRLVSIFLPDASGRRPVFGSNRLMQTDPAWRDQILFHEYFHGDTGAGLGASHQTGWTGLVLDLIADRRLGGRH